VRDLSLLHGCWLFTRALLSSRVSVMSLEICPVAIGYPFQLPPWERPRCALRPGTLKDIHHQIVAEARGRASGLGTCLTM
jgi:hypothetical protein